MLVSLKFRLILLAIGVVTKIGWHFFYKRLRAKVVQMEADNQELIIHSKRDEKIDKRMRVLYKEEKDELIKNGKRDAAVKLSNFRL